MRNKGVIICFSIGLVLGIFVTGAGFFIYQLDFRIRQAMMETKMISEYIKGALTFEDTDSMMRILKILESDESVLFGGAYNTKGKLVAYYCPKGILPRSGRIDTYYQLGCNFGRGHVKISEPVLLEGERTGTICIHYKLLDTY